MNIIDRIAKQQREKTNRQETAYAMVRDLPVDDRWAVLMRLIEAEQKAASASEPSRKEGPRAREVSDATYVEKAVMYVRSHPEGVRTKDVSHAIGQDPPNADGTLRQALKHGSIERRDRKWFPALRPTSVTDAPREKTIREVLTEVFTGRKEPLGASDIYHAAIKIMPKINHASVYGEINRMKTAGLLATAGRGPRGDLYALATGVQPGGS